MSEEKKMQIAKKITLVLLLIIFNALIIPIIFRTTKNLALSIMLLMGGNSLVILAILIASAIITKISTIIANSKIVKELKAKEEISAIWTKVIDQSLFNTNLVVITMQERVKVMSLGWQITNQDGVIIPILTTWVVEDISMDDFHSLLFAGAKKQIFTSLQGKLMANYTKLFSAIGTQALNRLIPNICKVITSKLDETLQSVQSKEGSKTFFNSQKLLQQITDAKLSRFQQDIVAGIEESLNEQMGNLRESVLERIKEKIFTPLKISGSSSPNDLIPHGARFITKVANRTIVVVEQNPQLRTVIMEKSLLQPDFLNNLINKKEADVQLAFPYTIFVVELKNGRFSNLYLFYSNKPLGSLDQELFDPNLPNISKYDCKVCLGFRGNFVDDLSLSEKVEKIIAHFWQSTFTNELTDNYMSMRNKDGRLANILCWRKNSQEDPLFVLEVKWQKAQITLKKLIHTICKSSFADKMAEFDHLAQEAITETSEKAGEIVRSYCAQLKPNNSYPKMTVNILSKALKNLTALLTEEVMAQVREITNEVNPELLQMLKKAVLESIDIILKEDWHRLLQEIKVERQSTVRELIKEIVKFNQTANRPNS